MNKPKILVWDIETAGNIVYTFQIGRKVSISHEQILKEKRIITICWKIVGEKKVHSLQWDSKQDDKKMISEFIKVLNSVDVAVGHNGDNFDLKTLKARALFHKLPPITNIATIDTLKISRQNFRLNSHRLDYISKYLGSKGKMDTGGLRLWLDVEKGNKAALNKMVKYCKQDVTELETVLLEILPYCSRMPVNMSIIKNGDKTGCPMCGGTHYHKHGFYQSRANRYQKYKCQDCGHVFKTGRPDRI